MKKLTIVFPLPLPTTNRLLAMNRWGRKKLRDLTDKLTSMLRVTGTEQQTRTMEVVAPSSSLMVSLVAEYLQMIRPKKLGTSKKLKRRSARRKRKR